MYRYFFLFLTLNLILADYMLGPYEVLLKQLGRCADEGTKEIAMLNGKIRRKSKTKFSLTSVLAFKNDLEPENFNLDLDMASMGGNGVWREHFYYQKCGKFCDSFKMMLPKFFANFLKTTGVSCTKVIAKGNYSINNMDLTLDFHMPFVPYNNYKIDVILIKNKRRVGCFQLFADVIPKRH